MASFSQSGGNPQSSLKEHVDSIALNMVSSLEIVGEGLGDEGADAIAQALLHNTSLHRLVLTDNGITDKGGRCIAEVLRTNRTLTSLGLQDNEVTDATAEAFAECLSRDVSVAGASGASKMHEGNGLRTLMLGYNDISSKGCAALLNSCRAAKPSSLTSLDLQFNDLGPEAAASIASVLVPSPASASELEQSSSGLVSLGLLQTGLGSSGVEAIARSLVSSDGRCNQRLRSLDLSNNEAGDSGCSALARALEGCAAVLPMDDSPTHGADTTATQQVETSRFTFPSLEHLYLFDSDIGVAGCASLAKCLQTNPFLTAVDLEENDDLEFEEEEEEEGLDSAKSVVEAVRDGLAKNRARKVDAAVSAIKKATQPDSYGHAERFPLSCGEAGGTRQNLTLELNFEGDGIGDKGAITIANALKEVNAHENSASPTDGTAKLVLVRVLLNLSDCGITEKGAAAIAESCEEAVQVLDAALTTTGTAAHAATKSLSSPPPSSSSPTSRPLVIVDDLSLKYNPIFKETNATACLAAAAADDDDDEDENAQATQGASRGRPSAEAAEQPLIIERINLALNKTQKKIDGIS